MIAARDVFPLVFFVGSFATLGIPASSQSLKSEPNAKFSAVIYGGHSLKGDGMGPYVQGQQETQVSGNFSFNILCWDHVSGMSNKPDPSAKAPRERSMIFDLSHPVPGSGPTALQTTWDYLARFHVFWKHDHENESMVILTKSLSA